jgi:hypothetical protein
MSFTWYANIPSSSQKFSISQPQLQTNTQTLNSIIGVDHVAPSSGGPTQGQHLQVTLPGNNVPGAQSGLASIIYTDQGEALNTASQFFWVNSQATFHVSAIRAWAFCNSSGIVSSQSSNVSSVSRSGQGQYVVTLTSGAVNSSNFGVLVSATLQNNFTTGVIPGYVITGTGTLQLNFRSLTAAGGIDPTNFTFSVYQI